MDIDIDTPPKFDPTKIFPTAIPASMVKNGELTKHPCGHYFQTIPVDSHTNLSAIPYKEAEEVGYMKIDFLHLHVLDFFESKEEIRALLKREPDWNILLDKNQVKKLFQLHRNADLLAKIRPRSIEDLADCIALIRPAKRRFIDDYIRDKQQTRKLIYRDNETDDKSAFRRSHAISYAMTIVLQLHLIEIGVL